MASRFNPVAIISGLQAIKDWLLDLIFPRNCYGCGREGASICPNCIEKLDIVPNPIDREANGLEELISVALYRDPLWQKVLQSLKYDYNIEISSALDDVFIKLIRDNPDIKNLDFDAVVPVPLHQRRYLERGFNQAEIIAEKICQFTGWPLEIEGLIRTRNTPPQARLEDDARRKNVEKAFSVATDDFFKNKKVILVDDVFTTGSTLYEAAAAVRSSGAKKISAWVVTRRSRKA